MYSKSMLDDEKTTQNQDSEENSIPASPQEPTEPSSENTAHSEPSVALPEAPEALGNDFTVKSNDIPPSNSIPTEAESDQKIKEKQAENEPTPKPVSEPEQAPELQTAQTPVNEPLGSKPDSESKTNLARNLWNKALFAIQFRKRKKLDRVMSLFLQKSKITNDEVEKLLHVSDATATRYLSILEKEGKIKQSGKTGKSVSYSRI